MNDTILTYLSKEDYKTLQEEAFIILDSFIKTSPLEIMNPKFDDNITNYIHNILSEQISGLTLDKNLWTIIETAKQKYFKHVIPPRSYPNTFVRISCNKEKMHAKIEYIKNIPQPDQRTPEWYTFRHKYLTASSAWKAFSSQSAQNQLIYGKCCPLDVNKYKRCDISSPMHHGNKYEPVSIMYYEKFYKTQVSDFGCIPHGTHDFLAASPDGINTDINSELYGRMLEVKNIVNREINGIPKFEYWIQMQLQMEACDLNECDFLETRFNEYDSKEDFDLDGTFTHTADNKLKGVIMYFSENDNPIYEYYDLIGSEELFKEWEERMLAKHANKLWMKNLYWRLDTISCVLVLRNKLWFKHALPVLKNLWDTIHAEKNSDFSHRAPKKRPKPGPFSEFKSSKCYVNLNLSNKSKNTVKSPPKNNAVINITTEKLVTNS